jgi:hypothetical protein
MVPPLKPAHPVLGMVLQVPCRWPNACVRCVPAATKPLEPIAQRVRKAPAAP